MTLLRFPLLLPPLLAALHAHGAWGVAYAPPSTEPHPVVVYLHGMWSSPEEACPTLLRGAPDDILVCPRGNAPMTDGSGGKMWTGNYATVAPAIHAAMQAAANVSPGPMSPSGGVLAGYSNGAYFAVEVATHEPGRWRGLVLLSMRLDLDASRLRAAGIERVVLASGDKDMATPSMRAAADALDRAGLPARYVSLGPGGHELPADLDVRLVEPLAWVRAAL